MGSDDNGTISWHGLAFLTVKPLEGLHPVCSAAAGQLFCTLFPKMCNGLCGEADGHGLAR